MTLAVWKYEVDESRKRKHHWAKEHAGFVDEGGEVVGKCPCTISLAEAERLLLDQGISWSSPHLPEMDSPDKIYVVHEGVVYCAVPTVRGVSYHGYPELPERLRRLPKTVRQRILKLADDLGCMKEVQQWMDK